MLLCLPKRRAHPRNGRATIFRVDGTTAEKMDESKQVLESAQSPAYPRRARYLRPHRVARERGSETEACRQLQRVFPCCTTWMQLVPRNRRSTPSRSAGGTPAARAPSAQPMAPSGWWTKLGRGPADSGPGSRLPRGSWSRGSDNGPFDGFNAAAIPSGPFSTASSMMCAEYFRRHCHTPPHASTSSGELGATLLLLLFGSRARETSCSVWMAGWAAAGCTHLQPPNRASGRAGPSAP